MKAPMKGTYTSIIIPVYNEEQRIGDTLAQLTSYLQEEDRARVEVIVVDDGSTDATRDIVLEEQAKHPAIRLLKNPHSGKSYTVRTGILAARGEICVHADADFSTPPHEFFKLVDAIRHQGVDVAIGSRAGRPGAPIYRKLMSIVWRLIVSLFVVQGFRDTQCGFKAYRSDAIKKILAATMLYNTPEKSLSRARVTAGSDVEILFVARKMGFNIAEIPLAWTYGKDTKISPLGDSLSALVDLFKIRLYDALGRYQLELTEPGELSL